MAKTMLIDATHPEETRVAVVDGRKLEEFDVEVASRRPLKGNIYLAKVTRVEPSLQAAFVEYGGNRHGFLAFSEIHPDYYRIPVADREALLREAAEALEEEGDDGFEHRQHDERHDHDEHHDDHGDQDHHDEEDRLSDRDHNDDAAPIARDVENPLDVIVSESGEFVATSQTTEEAISGGDMPQPRPSTVTDDREVMDDQRGHETIALASRQDVLRGDMQTFASSDSATEEPRGASSDRIEDSDEIPASPQAEIVEVPVSQEVFDTATPEEAAIQDDPEADEERARRRRQRNMRRYKIQEVIKRRQILLVQVTKEERGNKGAALTTYLSLAGRYCVLMPNTDRGGGISRRITNANDRKRLKSIIDDLDAPEGMAVIVRTAGSERSKAEVKRDFEYLLRLWDEIREVTLRSTAPALIYEEASLIKRSIRDLYTRDIGDIIVAGAEAYMAAKSFMRTLTPSHAKRVQLYRDPSIPLFQRYQIESQLAAIHQPVVQLKSGGYIVINQTEALVAIDVNSGRSTKERNIEETALRTNLEAADEVARQLRLRDLAGLIVIDFIDMEENRNNAAVERRMKESLKNDRARIQIGRISLFGLLEMSRQRLHPSLAEASTEICPHCAGTGRIRSVDSTALHVLRMVEEEITRAYSPGVTVRVPGAVALYVLNQKRAALSELEQRRGVRIYLEADDSLIPPDYRLERLKLLAPGEEVQQRQLPPITVIEEDFDIDDEVEAEEDETAEVEIDETEEVAASDDHAARDGEARGRRRRRRRRSSRGERFRADEFTEASDAGSPEGSEQTTATLPAAMAASDNVTEEESDSLDDGTEEDDGEGAVEITADGEQPRRRRRRGRRGGRRRSRRSHEGSQAEIGDSGVTVHEGHGSGEMTGAGEQQRYQTDWDAGSGDQPHLDIMPTHWQQATQVQQTVSTQMSFAETEVPTSGVLERSEQKASPLEADQNTNRRRHRRDESDRSAKSRKPRRSREERAGNVDSEEMAADKVQETKPVHSRQSSEPVKSAELATGDKPALAVTVIGAEPAEDAPKRRGWWRRLMD